MTDCNSTPHHHHDRCSRPLRASRARLHQPCVTLLSTRRTGCAALLAAACLLGLGHSPVAAIRSTEVDISSSHDAGSDHVSKAADPAAVRILAKLSRGRAARRARKMTRQAFDGVPAARQYRGDAGDLAVYTRESVGLEPQARGDGGSRVRRTDPSTSPTAPLWLEGCKIRTSYAYVG